MLFEVWRWCLFFLWSVIIFGFFSGFLECFHELSSFLAVTFFKKIIFYIVEFFSIDLHSNFILIFVNLVVNSFIDLSLYSLWCNFFIGLNYAFSNLFILYFLLWINNAVWMILFNHCKILSFDFCISQGAWICSFGVTQDLIKFSWQEVLVKLRVELSSTERIFFLNTWWDPLWQKRDFFFVF